MGLGEKFKARREAKEAEKAEAERQHRIAIASDEANALHQAWSFARLDNPDDDIPGVMLKPGEMAYLIVDGAAFVEPKRTPGEWKGRSQGASIPIAKGVRYRVGASKGTFALGEERPTPTDQGMFIVTDRRFIFIGSKRTTEWAYSKLMGYDTEGPGTAFFNVSNRQKTTGVMFGTEAEVMVDAVIAAAIARFTGPEYHARLLAAMEAEYRYRYALWQALVDGGRPPDRSEFSVEVEDGDGPASNESENDGISDRVSPRWSEVLPMPDDLRESLRRAGFTESEGEEGFGIRHEGHRLKVFWLKSDSAARDEMVAAMAKALRETGKKARVAREDGYPYVNVTG